MSNALRHLLLVDDDRALSSILAAALVEEGFEVSCAHDGSEGLRKFQALQPDLLILDVLMPEMDGLELCRRIRRGDSRVPIILLTSRSEEVDRITGLDIGADDYVTKPFSTRELCARIRAIGRRLTASLSPGGTVPALQAGPLVIDSEKFEARWKGVQVTLTRSEFQVLLALVQRRGRVLAREQLLDLARGEEVVVTDRTVDTFIKRIRKKLKDVDPAFEEIETVIGVGYRYRESTP